MPPTPEKVREDRLRRMAQRQGLTILKSRRRDPLAVDYGTYWLQTSDTGVVYLKTTSLDEIEERLTYREGIRS